MFGELMLGIGDTYGEPVSDVRMEIYFRALSDMSFVDVRAAADIHVRTHKFFPRPAELREAVDGSVEDAAELAWINVQSLVRRCGYWWKEETQGPIPWPDEITKHAAMKLYGGWHALCEKLPSNGPEMLGTAKVFKAHYAAVSRQAVREALPPSRDEAAATLRGLKAKLEQRGLPTVGL
jgi:hypothetical protein